MPFFFQLPEREGWSLPAITWAPFLMVFSFVLGNSVPGGPSDVTVRAALTSVDPSVVDADKLMLTVALEQTQWRDVPEVRGRLVDMMAAAAGQGCTIEHR